MSTERGSLVHSSMAVPSPVPEAHLYWHFLVYQKHLDDVSESRNKQGKDGRNMHSYLSRKIGISQYNYEPVHSSAIRLTQRLKDLNDSSNAVIIRVRTAKHSNTPVASEDLEKLHIVYLKREEIINEEINGLKKSLSSGDFAALQNYILNSFSKNVHVVSPSHTISPEISSRVSVKGEK